VDTLLVALASFVGFIIAYNTYGRWLAKKIFKLDDNVPPPSVELRDDVDYCPSKKEILFGHHFTSIAGTGPIVGPAIAVFWGWLPALIWVLVGSVFIGAVHDFGSLVVSMRNKGQSVGDIAGNLISPRARMLFLSVLFFALSIVLGIFGLVIAVIFSIYPEAVISVWIEIPLAVAIGYWAYKKQRSILIPSLLALGVMYGAIWVGTMYPVKMPLPLFGLAKDGTHTLMNAVFIWTVILFVYCFIASILPVWSLLQPRDFINSHELQLAMVLLVAGLSVAALSGEANLFSSAPAIAAEAPSGAPAMFPFLFIVVACGAVSGFHSMVGSGTSAKQISKESDAQIVGYGAMLLEGALAVIVILSCTAGVGMGLYNREDIKGGPAYRYVETISAETGVQITGAEAWKTKYSGDWASFSLGKKVGAFIDGGGNFLSALGIPLKLAIGIMAVLAASFAATTLDTATRLQRYVVQEIGRAVNSSFLSNKYAATSVAVAFGLGVASIPGPAGVGSGGLIIWPIFGATNQLLACLALLVVVMYAHRKNLPIWFAAIPAAFMLVIPAWGMFDLMFGASGWLAKGLAAWSAAMAQGGGAWSALKAGFNNFLLFGVGLCVFILQAWLLIEAAMVWNKAKGAYPDIDATLEPVGAE